MRKLSLTPQKRAGSRVINQADLGSGGLRLSQSAAVCTHTLKWGAFTHGLFFALLIGQRGHKPSQSYKAVIQFPHVRAGCAHNRTAPSHRHCLDPKTAGAGLSSIEWGVISVLQEVTARFTDHKVTRDLNRVCECASDISKLLQNAQILSLLGLREQLLSGEKGQGSSLRPIQGCRSAGLLAPTWAVAHSTHMMCCLAGSAGQARLRDWQVKAGWI